MRFPITILDLISPTPFDSYNVKPQEGWDSIAVWFNIVWTRLGHTGWALELSSFFLKRVVGYRVAVAEYTASRRAADGPVCDVNSGPQMLLGVVCYH